MGGMGAGLMVDIKATAVQKVRRVCGNSEHIGLAHTFRPTALCSLVAWRENIGIGIIIKSGAKGLLCSRNKPYMDRTNNRVVYISMREIQCLGLRSAHRLVLVWYAVGRLRVSTPVDYATIGEHPRRERHAASPFCCFFSRFLIVLSNT